MRDNKDRVEFLDEIKALAILAVVVFHLGFFKYGYLGVDVFYAIAGYLTMKSACRALEENRFSPFGFLWQRIRRLAPLVILACIVSMIAGYVLMLPDDYENLAQGVIASSCFANNILCRISSGDYWAQNNDFKPLLHFWYLGALMQFYVFFVALIIIVRKNKKLLMGVVIVLSILSSLAWFMKVGAQSVRFYYIPWRLWEFGVGMFLCALHFKLPRNIGVRVPGLAAIGRASLSVYVWHYILLAFYRYSVGGEISGCVIVGYTLLLAFVSCLSYFYVEQSKAWWASSNKGFLLVFAPLFILTNVCAWHIYQTAGVVRDVPELDIHKHNAVPGLHNK